MSSALATYGLYAVVPSSFIGGYDYPLSSKYRAPAAYRYVVPVGYTHRAPATTTFVKYVEPEAYDYPVYALSFDPDLKK